MMEAGAGLRGVVPGTAVAVASGEVGNEPESGNLTMKATPKRVRQMGLAVLQ